MRGCLLHIFGICLLLATPAQAQELVKDINPGFDSGPADLIGSVGDLLLMRADDGVHGEELWISDGTTDGTRMVGDINLGAASARPRYAAEVNGIAFFSATDGIHGIELWKFNPLDLATAVDNRPEIPDAYSLSGIYPNPFNPEARFMLSLGQPQHVRIAVYDVLGREVARVHDGRLSARQPHTFVLSGQRWASGLYLVRAVGETFDTVRRAVLVK